YRRIFGSLGLPGRQLHFDARTTTVLYVFVTTWLFLNNTGIHLANSHGNSKERPTSVGDSAKASSCLECCNFSTGLGQEVFPYKVVDYEKFDEKFLSGKALLFYLHPDGPLTYLRISYQNENFQDYEIEGSPAEMASRVSSGPGAGGIPLHEFRKDVPPGWGDDTMVGPLVAGRLQGKAQRLGMQLRLPRPDGGVDVGSDALVRLSVDEVRDPQNQGVILQHSIPSGIQALCNSLKDAFGVSDQELVSQSIEAFFEFRRGKMSFQEYAIEFDIRLEEAVTRAGLDLNDVAKFYLFFRGSGLPYKFIEDIKLQLQGDLRRYQEARVLALRLITKKDDSGETFFEDTENNLPAEDGWDSHSWTEDGWSWVEDASPGHQAEYWLDQDFYEPYDDGAYYDESYDDWYENESWTEPWDEQPQGEHEAASSSEPAVDVNEMYPVKGKGNKGPGCSICGSRWHAASSCPVGANPSYGGGKGKGKSKGFGGPSGWKGKARKGFGKSKGKGKGKWTQKGKKGRGYYGYTMEKTLVGSFGESKMSSTPPRTKVVHFKLDHDDSPVLPLGSRPRAETESPEDAETATSSSYAKTLDFTFATGIYSDSLSYHTVLGVKRRGLLVDPGAASGLVGSETLRDLMEHCVPGNKEHAVQWRYDRTNSVSGINGTPEQTLGEVSLPLKMAELNSTYSAEVIGGEGSLCPALLSNPALRKQSSAILTNHFENGDGVLVIRNGKAPLPIDARKNVEQMLFTWSEEIQERWSDVRSSPKTFSTTTEVKREARDAGSSPKSFSTTTEVNRDEARDADSSPKTFSTTTEVERDEARDADSSPETFPTTAEVMKDEARDAGSSSETFSTNTEVHVFKDVSSASGSTKSMSSASGSPVSKPFLDGPDVRTTRTEDFWTLDREYLTRHHKVARRILFTPNCAIDCPIELSQIQGRRLTEIHYVPRNAAGRVLEDDWITATAPNYDLDHWSEDRRERARHYYRAIPEEFYTKSGRRPITPKNVSAWVKKAAGKSLRFQFWELCSGSGRLSLCLLMAQFMVGFPVDYRYSWDIGYAPHQALLQQVHHQFSPDHLFASPSCTPWSVASASKDKARRDEERRSELPTLEFLHDMSLSQHNQDRGFTLEQPHSSAMLRESPVAKLLNHSGIRIQHIDQCMLGATDELQRPVRKATAFLSNRRWRRTIRRCNGHKGLPHGELQGRFKGCCRICGPFFGLYVSYLAEDTLLGARQARARREAPPATPTTTTTPAPSSAAAGAPDRASGSNEAAPARMSRSDLEDITGPFKFLARSGDYSRVSLEVHSSLTIRPEPQLYLKAAMMQLIESCLEIFQATTSRDYDHWLSDPVLLRVFQDVFHEIMSVLGVLVSLRPWHRKVPDPYLSSACAPMRLLISGEIRSWKIHGLEDMRVLSHHQLHAPVEEADWHVHLFGFCQDDPDVDRDVPGSSSASARPAAVPVERENDGRNAPSLRPPQPPVRPAQGPPQPPAADPSPEEEGQGEEEFDAARPEADEEPKILKPLLDFKKVYKRLQSEIVQTDPVTAKRLLLGLHERFYHCPITDFKNMLLRAGLSSDILPLAEEAVMSCSICRKYARLPNRLQIKIGSAASSFNRRVQIDLFMHKDTWILLNVDEATHYKTAAAVKSREHQELLNSMFLSWFSIFGPPAQLVMDQETSLMGHEACRELERFNVERGIAITIGDLAKEAAMAHNISLNYGGATPSMCVFGVIPRPFYQDDSAGISTVVGTLQTDVTPFEKAIRVRQMALSMVQRAVAENRIARANRTRTHQLKIGELVPGVTRVDFHRETQGDVGWRGPAELLKINKDEGTAILSYQGCPYLVSLRHIRPHQAGVFVVLNKEQVGDLMELKHLTEKLSPYKIASVNQFPRLLGGAMIGQGVRQIHPPMGSCGVLLLWIHGDSEHASHEHNNEKPIVLKKVTTQPVDRMCFVCVYYFVNIEYRPEKAMRVVPSEGATGIEDDEYENQAASPMSTGAPMSISSDPASPASSPSASMDVGDTTEAKKGRLGLLLDVIKSEQVITKAVPTDFPMVWYGCDNNAQLAQWDIFMSRAHDASSVPEHQKKPYLFTWPAKHFEELYADLSNGEIYKVDDEADNITEDECYDIWPQVEEADAAEIKQFVETSSFQKMHVNSLTSETVIIDSVWVRKWKKVKSRLCARGCFDKQKDLLTTRSTTATRLSQRIVLSVSANEDLDAESWDISGAFLKGLTFERVRELLKARGVTSPVRKVVIVAPANVWRHLASFDSKFKVDFDKLGDYVLFCLKPVYGLSDAPLAWQLCLHGHFESQGGVPSLMDENLFYWRDKNSGRTTSLVTTHVDDCGAGGKKEWLARQLQLLQEKFGKVTRQVLPFNHCGVLYERIPNGFRMSQDSFALKLKPAEIASTRKDDELLSPGEVTMFRSILGGLLWLTATRLDLIAEVCSLQAQVTRAKVAHLRQANGVVKRARHEAGQGMGLYFEKLVSLLRLACVHDSPAAGNVRNYAQEGILVLLCEDRVGQFDRDYEHVLDDTQCQALGGRCHILWAHGAKAKRISYSTSHAETLAAVSGLEAGTLVSVRLAELLYSPEPPTLQSLIAQQERGVEGLPIDSYTDCRDFFELAFGDKNAPQDKNQRLYVLSFREARMSGRVRWMCLTPPESMTADALTKTMIAEPMMKLLTTGLVQFYNQEKHKMTLRALPRMDYIEEHHFDMRDHELIKMITKPAASVTACVTFVKPRFLCLAILATTASATTTSSPSTSSTSASYDDGWKWMITMVAIIIAAERMLCETARLWWRRLLPAQSIATPDDPMDVDEANLDAQDSEKQTYADLLRQLKDAEQSMAGLGRQLMMAEHEVCLRNSRIERMEDDLRARDREIRQLREDCDRLQRPLPRAHLPTELFATVATGRTFHRDRNCGPSVYRIFTREQSPHSMIRKASH
ncbi:RE2, partial [Symbiodinium sp. CCMP2456]